MQEWRSNISFLSFSWTSRQSRKESEQQDVAKKNEGPSLELNFLGDSLLPKKQHKECNINLEEVVSSLIQSAVSTASFIMKLLQRHFIHIMVNMF